MALTVLRNARFHRRSNIQRLATSIRSFHPSLPTLLPRRQGNSTKVAETLTAEDALEGIRLDYAEDDTTSAGHLLLQQKRRLLYYLRLIEHEMPKLVAYRKPFVPPTSAAPLIIRSIDYGGEDHPATVKRTIVIPVAQLPLRDEDSIHKFKLLAGPRWTPDAPSNSGVGPDEDGGQHGYIKISCEDFPKPAMNLKWASDTLDPLISEANNCKDLFKDVPLDTSHVYAKALKAKKGEHIRSRVGHRASFKDFPKEWLPTLNTKPDPVPPE